MKELIARWESKGKKFFVELYYYEGHYSYRTENGGGFIGDNHKQALEAIQRQISYLPSKVSLVLDKWRSSDD